MTGSLALRELASPGTTQDADKLVNWLIIYRTISLSLCIILTSLIAGHLLTVYRRSPRLPYSKSPLKDVALMLIKSAMLEIVSTLVYVITVGLDSPLQNIFLPILGQVQVNTSIVGAVFFAELLIIETLAGNCANVNNLSCGTPQSRYNDRNVKTSRYGEAQIRASDQHCHAFLRYGVQVFGATDHVNQRDCQSILSTSICSGPIRGLSNRNCPAVAICKPCPYVVGAEAGYQTVSTSRAVSDMWICRVMKTTV